jgi:hypothetical protein
MTRSTTQRGLASLQHGLFAVALCASAAAFPATAQSSLDVNGVAANSGSFGLQITLDSSCGSSGILAVPDQTISSPTALSACAELTAAAVIVQTGASASFTAGSVVAISNGFTVQSGADFSAILDSSLDSDAYVSDDSPNGETRYRARGYVDLDGVTLSPTNNLLHFIGYSNLGSQVFRVGLVHNTAQGERRMFVEARSDDGSWSSTQGVSEIVVPAGYNAFEIDWQAATAGQNDGALDIWLNDVAQVGLSGLDNDSFTVDSVRWGAIGMSSAISGTIDVDDFVSQRSGAIGLIN